MTEVFRVGQRVQLHPATDMWMRGARYGVVKRLMRTGAVAVTLDLLPKQTFVVRPELLMVVHDEQLNLL